VSSPDIVEQRNASQHRSHASYQSSLHRSHASYQSSLHTTTGAMPHMSHAQEPCLIPCTGAMPHAQEPCLIPKLAAHKNIIHMFSSAICASTNALNLSMLLLVNHGTVACHPMFTHPGSSTFSQWHIPAQVLMQKLRPQHGRGHVPVAVQTCLPGHVTGPCSIGTSSTGQ
jgi:hypothetical protein